MYKKLLAVGAVSSATMFNSQRSKDGSVPGSVSMQIDTDTILTSPRNFGCRLGKRQFARGSSSSVSCSQDESPGSSYDLYNEDQAECKRQRSLLSSSSITDATEALLRLPSDASMDAAMSCSEPSDVTDFASPSEPSCQFGSFSSAGTPRTVCSSAPQQQDQETTDFEHWLSREGGLTPHSMFRIQTNITPAMREMLVEWMFEVVAQFRMDTETFMLAVNYLDRYLCQVTVSRGRFQLLGIACLWLASKFEEVHPPSAQQLLDMAENTYNLSELVDIETNLACTLEWNLSPPTALKFLHTYLVKCQVTSQAVQVLAECMLQLSTLDCAASPSQLPSRIAAAAACVALSTFNQHVAIQAVVEASHCIDDRPNLATMCQDLHARYDRMVRPGGPVSPMIAQYALRRRALAQYANKGSYISSAQANQQQSAVSSTFAFSAAP